MAALLRAATVGTVTYLYIKPGKGLNPYIQPSNRPIVVVHRHFFPSPSSSFMYTTVTAAAASIPSVVTI